MLSVGTDPVPAAHVPQTSAFVCRDSYRKVILQACLLQPCSFSQLGTSGVSMRVKRDPLVEASKQLDKAFIVRLISNLRRVSLFRISQATVKVQMPNPDHGE